MAEPLETYKKMPGRLRGIGYGGSVWLGPDHLLLARTRVFREDYKRFYLRDIQAIVAARQPRFHVSIRALAAGGVWAILGAFLTVASSYFLAAYLGVFSLLFVAWLVVSWKFSCRCRIYTAVSNEELPSLYRTWNARKFLEEVRPWIEEVQGRVEGNWTETMEARQAGPAPAQLQPAAVAPASALPGPPTGAPRSVASDIFIGGLLASAAVDLATLHSVTTAVRVIGISLSVAVIAAAVWVLIQCSRGTLLPWLRKLVIATVAVMGLEYYAGTLVASLGVSGQTLPLASNATLMSPGFVVLRELSSGAAVMLGIAGVVLVLRGRAEQPDIIYKEPETPAPSKLPGTPEE